MNLAPIRIALCLLGAASLGGCSRPSPEPGLPQGETRVVPDLVARVGDRGIGVSDVEARMVAEGIGAEVALQKLIDDELLAGEAERLGLSLDPEGERAIERVMVRALLHDLEAENTPESISNKEVREEYAKHQDKLRIPERRRSSHILVKAQSDAARAVAESILRELREARDPRTVFERYAEPSPREDGLEVVAEELPEITAKANIERPYKKALFAARAEGPLEDVVRTSYGWHAIVVDAILPDEHRALEDVEEEIRESLSQHKRLQRLAELLRRLDAQGLVKYNAPGVERLLAMSGLPARPQ